MITVKTFVFNPFEENTYLLYDNTNECIVIDPGCYSDEEKEELISFIGESKLTPVKLFNTHCHVDHVIGNSYLCELYKIKTGAHKLDNPLLNGAAEHGKVLGFEIEQPPPINVFLQDNEIIKFGNSRLKVIHVPGHSPGSIVFYGEEQKFVIAGDVLFNGSIGRTDLPGGDYEILIKNITNKLLVLGDDVVVYSGHGPVTTIGNEKRTNPYLN